MRQLSIIFLLLFIWGCTNVKSENDKVFEKFTSILGYSQSKALIKTIEEVEKVLRDYYKVENVTNAYDSMLNYMYTTDREIYRLNIPKSERTRLLTLYEMNGLRKEIWEIENIDGVYFISTNIIGTYMEAFKEIQSLHEVGKHYYWANYAAGAPSYKLIAEYFIYNNIDYNDYIIKTIFIADLFYVLLTNSDYVEQKENRK